MSSLKNLINTLNNSILFQYVLFVFFTLLYYFLLKDYVLYRDDARPPLIVNYNHSIFDLIQAVRYEGTPMLYHIMLWVLSCFVKLTPLVVKIFHLLIHVFILITILFLIKLPNFYRLLILLQIPQIAYVLYVRQYSIAVLLIFLFAYLYTTYEMDNIWIYIVLFLLPQTIFHGFIVAFVFFLFIAIRRYIETKQIFHKYYLIPFFGFILSILQLIPPKDFVSGLNEWRPLFSHENLLFIRQLFWDIFLDNLLIYIAFILLIFIVTKDLLKKNKALAYNFLFCLVILLVSFYIFGAGKYSFNRHHWLASCTIMSFLIMLTYPIKQKITNLTWKEYGLLALVFFSFLNFKSLIPKYLGLNSNGQNAAIYLDKNYPNNNILGELEYYIEPIVFYRKEAKPYFSLGRNEFVKYNVLNHKSVDFTKFKEHECTFKVSELINDLNNTPDIVLQSSPILVLSAFEIVNDINMNLEGVKIKQNYFLKHLKDFDGARFENYSLYLVKRLN